jgi:hypothetical protein
MISRHKGFTAVSHARPAVAASNGKTILRANRKRRVTKRGPVEFLYTHMHKGECAVRIWDTIGWMILIETSAKAFRKAASWNFVLPSLST